MQSSGLPSNIFTLNILLNCFCNVNRVCDGFVVMGSILSRGYSPDTVTYTSLRQSGYFRKWSSWVVGLV